MNVNRCRLYSPPTTLLHLATKLITSFLWLEREKQGVSISEEESERDTQKEEQGGDGGDANDDYADVAKPYLLPVTTPSAAPSLTSPPQLRTLPATGSGARRSGSQRSSAANLLPSTTPKPSIWSEPWLP